MNIYIAGDFLMTSNLENSNNTKWLNDFLSHPIYESTSTPPQILNFDRNTFLDLSNIDYTQEDRHVFYDVNEISDKSLEYITSNISTNDLLICYELSEATKKILQSLNLTYIDIWLHPIRFIDDVLFSFYSNNEKINNNISQFNINDSLYYTYANNLKVQGYRGFKKANANVKHNSALFIGQTLNDKALFNEGKMLSVLDFKEKFTKLTQEHNHVYYSRHPFVKSGDEQILNFVRKFRNTSIIEEPAYDLLVNDNIKKVASISSSVVIESKYFGKEHEYFYKTVIDFDTKKTGISTIFQEFLFGHFWSTILKPVVDTNEVDKLQFLSQKNKIRDSLSFYWGYRNIDKVEVLKKTVGDLFKKIRG